MPPCLGKTRNRRPCTAAGRRRPTENNKRYNVKYRPSMTNQPPPQRDANGDKSARVKRSRDDDGEVRSGVRTVPAVVVYSIYYYNYIIYA